MECHPHWGGWQIAPLLFAVLLTLALLVVPWVAFRVRNAPAAPGSSPSPPKSPGNAWLGDAMGGHSLSADSTPASPLLGNEKGAQAPSLPMTRHWTAWDDLWRGLRLALVDPYRRTGRWVHIWESLKMLQRLVS